MNFPSIITNKLLAAAAAPDEAFTVRLAILHVNNLKPYVLHGRAKRHYHFEFNAEANCHTLDIPGSVWSKGIDGPLSRDNPSIAYDILRKVHGCGPIMVLVIPANAKPVPVQKINPSSGEAIRKLDELVTALEGPEIIHEAISLIAGGDEDAEVTAKLSAMIKAIEASGEPEASDEPQTAEKPAPVSPPKLSDEERRKKKNAQAAERMRKKRERDKAAKLQTAKG